MQNNGDEKEKNIKKITIRVTQDEAEKINKKAMESYLTQNEYIKRSALNKDIIVIEGLKDLTVEIKRIGININQIARRLNECNNLTEKEKDFLLNEVKKLWQLLKQFTERNL